MNSIWFHYDSTLPYDSTNDSQKNISKAILIHYRELVAWAISSRAEGEWSDSEWPTVDQFSIPWWALLRSTLKSNLKQFKQVLKGNAYEMPLMPRGAQIVWSLNMLKHVETSVSSVAPHHRFRTTDTPIHRAPVAAEVPMATNGKRIASPNISSSKMFQEMNSLTTFCKCLKLPILDSIRFVMCTVCFLRFSDCTRGLIWGWMGYVLMRVEGLLGDSLWWIRWFSEWWGTEVRMSCIHLQHIFSYFFYRSMFTISGYFRFVFYFWCFVCRQSPPGDPTPQPIASWPCRASERDFSARPRPSTELVSRILDICLGIQPLPVLAWRHLPFNHLQPKTVWLLFNSSDLNREMFLIAHVAIFFRATSPATQNRQKKDSTQLAAKSTQGIMHNTTFIHMSKGPGGNEESYTDPKHFVVKAHCMIWKDGQTKDYSVIPFMQRQMGHSGYNRRLLTKLQAKQR